MALDFDCCGRCWWWNRRVLPAEEAEDANHSGDESASEGVIDFAAPAIRGRELGFAFDEGKKALSDLSRDP